MSEHESEETIQGLKEKIKEKEDHYLRIMADFDNYRKRMERDVEAIRREGEKELILELLEVIDNMERALFSEGGDPDSLKEGVRGIYQQFVDILKRHGVVPLEATGMEFDPRIHEAISTMESQHLPTGTIGEELRKGYMIEEELLRPSLVRVVKN